MEGMGIIYLLKPYIITELVKNYSYSKVEANFSYYRDSNAKEIDLIIEYAGKIHPFEIKRSANSNTREVKKFKVLDTPGTRRGEGGIICMSESVLPIDNLNCYIPCGLI